MSFPELTDDIDFVAQLAYKAAEQGWLQSRIERNQTRRDGKGRQNPWQVDVTPGPVYNEKY